MRSVRQKHSSPELVLRSVLHREGLRFRTQRRIESVSVDIVFIKPRVAILADGCFWHGCPVHATYPKTNTEYWLPKLRANREMDQRQTKRLIEAGWNVIRVWEHDFNHPSAMLVEQIRRFCTSGGQA